MIKDITLGYQFLPLNWKEEILPRMGEGARWATLLSLSMKCSNTIKPFAKHAVNPIMRVLYKFG